MPVEELRFTVPGMSCGHCVSAVDGEIRKLEGVDDVDVDLDSKVVVVRRALDWAAMTEAVDEAGYDLVR